MSDDDHEGMTPQEFWKLVNSQKIAAGDQSSSPPTPPPEVDTVIDAQPLETGNIPPPETGNSSLEERLLVAQGQGLESNLRRQLAFVGAGEKVFELQTLGVKRYPNDAFDKSRAAHARGPEEAVALCAEADKWIAHGIYLMPARLRPGVESRHASPGRWFDIPKGSGTTDSDIDARLILAVDFDVKRPSAISATEEEMQRSVRVALNAWSYLAHHLGESSLAYLHSGNGRQIHIALDAIPVTDQSKNACAGLLTGLAHLFNTPEVSVDEKLYDAKRILPACGTVKKKGAADVDERPHRRTAIVTPTTQTRVPLEKIVELARFIWEGSDAVGRVAIEKSFGVKPQTANVVTGMRDNPDSPFGRANDVDPQAVAEWLGLYNSRGEVVCPGCGETSGVAVLNHGLKCHHNRCKDKGRNGFRTNIDMVAEVHRVTPKEALAEIGERFGVDVHLRGQDPTPIQQHEPPAPSDPSSAAPVPATTDPPATGGFAYPPRFKKVSTTEIFEKLPPVNWLVEDLHLVAGRPTLIAGYGFSGKTLIAQSALLGIASATPVWGKFAPKTAASVWHLDYEQGSYATKKRYQRLARGHGIPRDALGERLQVTIFPEVYLDSPDAVDAYTRAVEGVSVVALDALRGATPTMDENDSTIRRCLDNLSRISEKTGTAFIVLHHAGKSRDSENSDPRKIPRGSSAIFDACGCVFAIEGEKNDPKLVCQTKAPAEAEGGALADFYVSIEDVAGEEGPTVGLRVLHQDAGVTEIRVVETKLTERKEKILALVDSLPGKLTSGNSILERVGGKRSSVGTAIKELFEAGLLAQPGGAGTPIVSRSGTGSRLVPDQKEPVPGSPPFRGEPGTRTHAVPAPGNQSADRDRERAALAEQDAALLYELDERDWRAKAAELGWQNTRSGNARAIAKSRQQKARADAVALHQVQLRGEEPRAWATEQGWPDERTTAGLRFVKPAPARGTDPSRPGTEAAQTASPAPVSASPPEQVTKTRKRGRPDPAYQDPNVLEANAVAFLEVLDEGMTVEQIEISPKSHWTPADVEVLLGRLVGDGRIVERDRRYFRKPTDGD